MGGESGRSQRPPESPLAHRFQRVRIDLVAQPVFLGHEQPPGVPDRRGVGDRPIHSGNGRIVGKRVAITAEQCAPRSLLRLVAIGFDIADVEIHRVAANIEAGDHPVGIEGDVVFIHRRMRIVRHGAKESAIHFRRDFSLNLQIADGNFHSPRLVRSDEMDGVWKCGHWGPSPEASRPLLQVFSFRQI